MKVLKYSRQRESIKASLMCRHDHPTADALYASIREEFPNISLGTVYRNLNLLVETGEIRRISCGDGADHFDGNTDEHYHFMCRECGRIYDMQLEAAAALRELDSTAQGYAPGVIDSHSVMFFGRCQDCIQKSEKQGIDKPA
ncbi:MAG TPA: transcriptional repressor [Candidatus Enterocloster excrementipullorum]|uniref:Transcriptional repressor n=1 Tax=Candidatus Enterocloster excrementipullorum TaxID=2838559 RepID=A0A9D2N141_9FIRM|nr:transcriptional repressor [Candidatus Enterocloster excrementipullorum]